ncbi:hypothetical protein SFOMI_1930 [Sphingobium fuliginis]|uniref:Uncharacterized protein n=1 Tax=Sphingobium fuliginis (strain ATCC 27551) TaxID=336203 RepID=A0A292ZEU9_SPHSA|nr:hypothetical protein SFOMI_1930 [Sphingobium fuliginis]
MPQSLFSSSHPVRAELVEAPSFPFEEKCSPSTSSGRTEVVVDANRRA